MPATFAALDQSNAIIAGCKVWDEGLAEDFQQFNSQATRTIVTRWTDRQKVINALNPGATTLGAVQIYSTPPCPDNPLLYPTRFQTKGSGNLRPSTDGSYALWDYARIMVTYKAFGGADPQGYVKLDYGANVITLPRSGVVLETVDDNDSNPLPVPFQDTPGKPVAVTKIIRGASNVAGLNMKLLNQLLVSPVSIGDFLGFPAGAVLFNGGCAIRQTATNVGSGLSTGTYVTNFSGTSQTLDGAWNVEYSFIARPEVPWDYLGAWTADGKFAGFRKARFTNGKGPYLGRSDLNQLFTPANGFAVFKNTNTVL